MKPDFTNAYNNYRVIDLYFISAEKYNKADAICSKRNGRWEKFSMLEIIASANKLSQYLLDAGIKKGDKIAIVSTSRYEWHITDLAILQIGAISVPVYANLTTKDYEYIFNEAGVKFLIVSCANLYQHVQPLTKKGKKIQEVISFDELKGTTCIHSILDSKIKPNIQKLETLRSKIKQEDIASIIYTSGTTRTPKGVMLSHLNIVSNVIDSKANLQITFEDRSISFLPLNHIFERVVTYIYIYSGVSMYFAQSMETIGEDIREIKPHFFTAVPRLLEKVFEKIMAKGAELSGIKKALFFWSVGLAKQYDLKGKNNNFFYNLKLGIARKLIFSKWQLALGGNLRFIVTGAAACQLKLLKIFNTAGIPIREGYGLTETSPVVSVNKFDDFYLGTAGLLIPNVQVKIADDGEILLKGPNIMHGYFKNEKETKSVFTKDGWFMTGDVGDIIENKYLKITDRKKEIFKTSGGKYIAPQYVENLLKSSHYIEQVMVIGAGQKFPSALIQPNWDSLTEWAKKNGVAMESKKAFIRHPLVMDLFHKEVEKINHQLAQYERIKKPVLVEETWSPQTDELTPTLKLKRRVILLKYQQVIDKIYHV